MRSDERAPVADWEYRSEVPVLGGCSQPVLTNRFYARARAWGKCLTCPELEYNGWPWVSCGSRPKLGPQAATPPRCDLWIAAIFLIAIHFWDLRFMRVLPMHRT